MVGMKFLVTAKGFAIGAKPDEIIFEGVYDMTVVTNDAPEPKRIAEKLIPMRTERRGPNRRASNLSDTEVEMMIRMHRNGAGCTEIGRRIGCAVGTVRRRLRKAGALIVKYPERAVYAATARESRHNGRAH